MHRQWRVLVWAAVHALYWQAVAHAAFFSVVAESPPYLLHTGSTSMRLDWDSGGLARHAALSHGVFVNHQGVRAIRTQLHISVPSSTARMHCEATHGALCWVRESGSLILPSNGTITVSLEAPEQTREQLPRALATVRDYGCPGPSAGKARVLTDTCRYDVSACDVNTMQWGFLLHRGELFVAAFPFSGWLYFAVCVSTIVTLTYILLILQPLSGDGSSKGVAQSSVDFGLANALVCVCTMVGVQTRHSSFLTLEDYAGFVFAFTTFYFYFVLTLLTRWDGSDTQSPAPLRDFVSGMVGTRPAKHAQRQPGAITVEPGLALDTFVCTIVCTCIGAYGSLEHPFNVVTLSALVFRMWNKLLRLVYAHGFNPTIPLLVLRLLLDCVNIAFGVCCAWNLAHEHLLVAGVWFIPLILAMYALAKLIFLSHTCVS